MMRMVNELKMERKLLWGLGAPQERALRLKEIVANVCKPLRPSQLRTPNTLGSTPTTYCPV